MLEQFSRTVVARLEERASREAEEICKGVKEHDRYFERVGFRKGLREAIDLIKQSLKDFAEDPDEHDGELG